MSCRESRAGSALTTIARLQSGLSDVQTLSAFHALRSEAPAVIAAPTLVEFQDFLTRQSNSVARDDSLTDARRASLLRRLEAARAEAAPDGRTWYALRTIGERTQRQAESVERRLGYVAEQTSTDIDTVRSRYRTMMDQTPRNRRGATPPGYTDAVGTAAAEANLPTDPASAAVLHALNLEAERARADRALSGPQRIERGDIGSGLFAEAGYDPDGGRLELVFRGSGDRPNSRVYTYRGIPPEVWERMQSGSASRVYNDEIRGRDEYRYPTQEEADLDSAARQCGDCGQFAASAHACPTRTARQARATTASRNAQSAAERLQAAVENRPVSRNASTFGLYPSYGRMNRTARYYEPGAYDRLNMPPAAALRSAAATQPVDFTGSSSFGGYHAGDLPGGRVAFEATFDRPERGQHLLTFRTSRCTCEAWQEHGHCPHIDRTFEATRDRLVPAMGEAAAARNAAAQEAYDAVRQAQMAVEAERREAERLAAEERAAEAAREYARQWVSADPADSYANNPAAFEADRAAALARKARGESAIEYQSENATGGLCAPGSGRAFGVELEFDVAPGVDRHEALAAIGRDLHAAGLTRSANQAGYHAGMSRGYTENHQGGWSYEQDCTVSGEIVSPIMYDTPETWENLAKVCDIVKRHGGVASVRTGSHVHVGTPNTSTQTATGLLRLANKHEDLMYRISQNPERGSHRPMQWCGPNAQVPSQGYTSVGSARMANNSHGLGVNLQSVTGSSSDHAEIRHWDGTLDASVIQAQIKVSAAMVAAAQRGYGHEPVGGATRVGTGHDALRSVLAGSRRNLTTEEDREDTKSARDFADILFNRRQDKAQFAALFAITKWNSDGL